MGMSSSFLFECVYIYTIYYNILILDKRTLMSMVHLG